MRSLMLAAACACAAAPALRAQAQDISVTGAWARATAAGAATGAVYLTVTDHAAPDRLIVASTPVAAKAQLHETIANSNVMQMREVAYLAVKPGTPLVFAPGGYHIMLLGLRQQLKQGQSFPLTLVFAKSGPLQINVDVKGAGARPPMQMDGMSMPMGEH